MDTKWSIAPYTLKRAYTITLIIGILLFTLAVIEFALEEWKKDSIAIQRQVGPMRPEPREMTLFGKLACPFFLINIILWVILDFKYPEIFHNRGWW